MNNKNFITSGLFQISELFENYDNFINSAPTLELMPILKNGFFLYQLDYHGNIIRLNKSAEAIIGYTQAELPLNYSNLVIVEDHKLVENSIEISRNHKAISSYEVQMRHKNGSEVYLELVGFSVFNEHDEFDYVVGIANDVTEKHQLRKLQTDNLTSIIDTLVLLIEKRDPYTAGHMSKVADISVKIGLKMGLSKHKIKGLKLAAAVHDLGKINIPLDILNKSGKLSENEFRIIKEHPNTGFDVLKDIDFIWPIKEIVKQHHERLDGTGYPDGLTGENILLEAKIVAVADIFDAVSSHRPYRPALDENVALNIIINDRGTKLCPEVVDAFLQLISDGEL